MVRVRVLYSDGRFRGGLQYVSALLDVANRRWKAPPGDGFQETLVYTQSGIWKLLHLARDMDLGDEEGEKTIDYASHVTVLLEAGEVIAWFGRRGLTLPFSRDEIKQQCRVVRQEIDAGVELAEPEIVIVQADDGYIFGDTRQGLVGHARFGTAAWSFVKFLAMVSGHMQNIHYKNLAIRVTDLHAGVLDTHERLGRASIAEVSSEASSRELRARRQPGTRKPLNWKSKDLRQVKEALRTNLAKAFRDRDLLKKWTKEWLAFDGDHLRIPKTVRTTWEVDPPSPDVM